MRRRERSRRISHYLPPRLVPIRIPIPIPNPLIADSCVPGSTHPHALPLAHARARSLAA
jgi:hypothetical protein